jgi:hypothetical protein
LLPLPLPLLRLLLLLLLPLLLRPPLRQHLCRQRLHQCMLLRLPLCLPLWVWQRVWMGLQLLRRGWEWWCEECYTWVAQQ